VLVEPNGVSRLTTGMRCAIRPTIVRSASRVAADGASECPV
jgi:hypothetical protein